MSKALHILSRNLDSLIGEGRRFKNDMEMGERTGMGQRQIHRIRKQETEPKLANLDVLSERLHIPMPALLSPNMDVLSAAVPADVSDLIKRICALAEKQALETHELEHLSSAVSLIERTRAALPLTLETRTRGTGT
jgi:DNA-binding phage protein